MNSHYSPRYLSYFSKAKVMSPCAFKKIHILIRLQPSLQAWMSLIALVHTVPLKSIGFFTGVKLKRWQTSSGKPPWSGLSCCCPKLPAPPFHWGLVLPQQNLEKGTCARTSAASLQNPQVQLKPFKMHRFLLSCWSIAGGLRVLIQRGEP